MTDAHPRLPHHPDRGLHAEEAVQPAFNSLAARAEAAGWSQDETAFALLNLALARIMALEANLETDEAIARAVRSIHGQPA